ncbi:hypothetical protein HDF14_004405 [Edaphobacter lichenicola]|uniref:Uncharacterized protein n=1 Tax=Tunturiibacter gelidiferens TaxID=3069689 RepID=A0A9X0QIA7_9BACT|nr:hypothetical protein [Edaphobacter lichenicola]
MPGLQYLIAYLDQFCHPGVGSWPSLTKWNQLARYSEAAITCISRQSKPLQNTASAVHTSNLRRTNDPKVSRLI